MASFSSLLFPHSDSNDNLHDLKYLYGHILSWIEIISNEKNPLYYSTITNPIKIFSFVHIFFLLTKNSAYRQFLKLRAEQLL